MTETSYLDFPIREGFVSTIKVNGFLLKLMPVFMCFCNKKACLYSYSLLIKRSGFGNLGAIIYFFA